MVLHSTTLSHINRQVEDQSHFRAQHRIISDRQFEDQWRLRAQNRNPRAYEDSLQKRRTIHDPYQAQIDQADLLSITKERTWTHAVTLDLSRDGRASRRARKLALHQQVQPCGMASAKLYDLLQLPIMQHRRNCEPISQTSVLTRPPWDNSFAHLASKPDLQSPSPSYDPPNRKGPQVPKTPIRPHVRDIHLAHLLTKRHQREHQLRCKVDKWCQLARFENILQSTNGVRPLSLSRSMRVLYPTPLAQVLPEAEAPPRPP